MVTLLLGPFEVRDGSAPARLGGRKPRALLARLSLDANRTVRPGDGVLGAPIAGRLRLEQCQHVLCAGRCPRRHDPPVAFAQRLRRAHVRQLRNCVVPR
jgi:hypothetical protein